MVRIRTQFQWQRDIRALVQIPTNFDVNGRLAPYGKDSNSTSVIYAALASCGRDATSTSVSMGYKSLGRDSNKLRYQWLISTVCGKVSTSTSIIYATLAPCGRDATSTSVSTGYNCLGIKSYQLRCRWHVTAVW